MIMMSFFFVFFCFFSFATGDYRMREDIKKTASEWEGCLAIIVRKGVML